MTLKQLFSVVPALMRYNMKVIFAGKFFWYVLAAFGFYAFFMFNLAWQEMEINEGAIFSILYFPGFLLVFYPAVFGIQNDEDTRILEILFGVPNYRYKVWGVRLLMIYLIVYVILVLFAFVGTYLLYPVDEFEMAAQVMFPVFFFGNLAFMLSTILRSGNGTAVVVIIIGILLMIFTEFVSETFWDIFINPYDMPRDMHPFIWESTILKSRIFLTVAGCVWLMIGSLNLQKREKFV
ncbi:MAG: hypothetical protein LBM61_08610 [Prevotellaceae bacterium]|jgi:hypothetical protein|nr:hypothetical protein [Prevotellaceae bacterium]